MEAPARQKPPSWPRRYALHLAMLLVIFVEFAVAHVLHRSKEELQAALTNGTAEEQVAALHVLANRDIPKGFNRKRINKMFGSEHSLIRDLSVTSNMMRFGPDHQKRRTQVVGLDSPREVRRLNVLLRHPGGKGPRFDKDMLQKYYRATRPRARAGRAQQDDTPASMPAELPGP